MHRLYQRIVPCQIPYLQMAFACWTLIKRFPYKSSMKRYLYDRKIKICIWISLCYAEYIFKMYAVTKPVLTPSILKRRDSALCQDPTSVHRHPYSLCLKGSQLRKKQVISRRPNKTDICMHKIQAVVQRVHIAKSNVLLIF